MNIATTTFINPRFTEETSQVTTVRTSSDSQMKI